MPAPKNTMLLTGMNSGLGFATFQRLAREFPESHIVGTSRKPRHPLSTTMYNTTCVSSVDVTQLGTLTKAFNEAQALGAVRVAINCAGILRGRGMPEHQDEEVLNTNVRGTINFLNAASLAMDDNESGPRGERGVIIVVSSMAHKQRDLVPLDLAAYAASKAGVDALVRLYADQLGRNSRIRVVGIAPGPFATPMMGVRPNFLEAGARSVVRRGPGPFPDRMGYPDEFAQLVEHVIRNPYINGTTIEISGNQ